MSTRRQFVRTASAAFAASPVLSACSPSSGEDYELAVAQTWRVGDRAEGEGAALVQELVRCATLAPSSHNTQCWRFTVTDRVITIHADLSRRCPAVDPDDHHLFVSLGCAAENLAQAALAHGFQAHVQFDAVRELVQVTLEPTRARPSALFRAIPARQCTRGDYDGQPLVAAELDLLAAAGRSPRVRMLLLTERSAMERVLEQVLQGNTAQMADPAFMTELKSWLRFNSADALRTRDGLFSVASGNPALPAWLGSRAFDWFFTAGRENDKYARQIRSAAGIAIFVAQTADKAHWVEVGRCCERFALQATALGVRHAFLNQPVEVVALRAPFAASLGLAGQRPDLVLRFGRGPLLPRSLRRPVGAVLV